MARSGIQELTRLVKRGALLSKSWELFYKCIGWWTLWVICMLRIVECRNLITSHTRGYRDVPCHTTRGYRDVPCHTRGYRDVPCHTRGYRDVPCSKLVKLCFEFKYYNFQLMMIIIIVQSIERHMQSRLTDWGAQNFCIIINNTTSRHTAVTWSYQISGLRL